MNDFALILHPAKASPTNLISCLSSTPPNGERQNHVSFFSIIY